jgi:tetratricopeptide (TPR) repeat protein
VSEPGYEILSIDDLDRYPSTAGTQILMPLRRRLGFEPFGINAWLGREVGDHVIERHREPKGPEELYLVLRGTASFTVDEETFEAPVGTLVHVPPDTLREATALEPETVVLAAGGKAGEAFTPSPWEDFAVAFARLRAGDPEGGREAMEQALARDPDAWQGAYNAACFAALAGDRDGALEYLRRAVAAGGDEVRTYAETDTDLDSIRDDPLYREALT